MRGLTRWSAATLAPTASLTPASLLGRIWVVVGLVVLPLTGRLQVLVQVGFEGERFVTLVALVVLVRGVGLHVGAQIRAVGERFAAVRASVRLLARVTSQVALQQPRPGEHLATDAAAMCQLVSQHVHRQRWHAHVRLATVDALLRRL